jgi:hypothetical protein
MALPGVGAYSVGHNLRVDGTVLAFTSILVVIAILASGLAPALHASSPNLSQIIGAEIVVGGSRKTARRHVLVVVQVAICTLVLVGLGLCERSLYNLRHSDLGFSTRKFVSAGIYPREATSDERMKQLNEAARDAVSRLPGVESVSLARDLPLEGLEVQAQVPGIEKPVSVGQAIVDGTYFDTWLAGFSIPQTAKTSSQSS